MYKDRGGDRRRVVIGRQMWGWGASTADMSFESDPGSGSEIATVSLHKQSSLCSYRHCHLLAIQYESIFVQSF